MNDYERYDFWFRETAQVKPETKERTMKKLIESNKKFDANGYKYDPNDRSEMDTNVTQYFGSILY